METKVNYTVVGLLVILLGAALIFLGFWLTTFKQGKEYGVYAAYVKEDVTGLSDQSVVRFNGVPVGYVQVIEIDPKDPQLVRLTLKIEKGTPITTSTTATLYPQGITGLVYVGLKAGSAGAPLLKAKRGQKHPVILSKPSILTQLSTVLPEVATNLKILSHSINDVFDEGNRQSIRNILKNTDQFTKTLSDNSQNLDSSMKSLRVALNNSAKASRELPQVMRELNSTLQSVNRISHQVDLASRSMTKTMKSGQVLVQNLSDQVMPNTEQLMAQLQSLTINLQAVATELRRNPSILVRGKQQQALGPGE